MSAAPQAPAERVLAIIPARYGSSRFPGKPLALLAGKPMICHVVERMTRAAGIDRVLVATDDERIAQAVRAHGGEVALTGAYETGTDRVAAVAAQAGHTGPTDWVLNVQGDEPLIDPADVARLVAARHGSSAGKGPPDVRMATLVHPIRSEREYRDPHIVKVVLDQARRALYFSRAPIPHHRDAPPGSDAVWRGAWRHLGVYLFRGDFLQEFRAVPPSPLALKESLEQLRALEHGHAIHCVEAHSLSPGVDVPDDLAHAEALLREHAGN